MKETLYPLINESSFNYKGIVITDLDGTLLDKNKQVKDQDYETLVWLKKAGFLRVLATGRSLYSLFKTIDHSFPIDYVIFSSGAGIWNQRMKDYLRVVTMESKEVEKVAQFFFEESLDFAVHLPIPENHYFSYYLENDKNHDFMRRIHLYKEFASSWEALPSRFPMASQLLAILTNHIHTHIYNKVYEKLPDCTVIRTTSPLDHTSLWIEVFPAVVSKGKTSCWLTSHCRIDKNKVLAIGNDYNDLDLLTWAKTAYIVSNGPDELKKMFSTVASHDECGFSEAVKKWLNII